MTTLQLTGNGYCRSFPELLSVARIFLWAVVFLMLTGFPDVVFAENPDWKSEMLDTLTIPSGSDRDSVILEDCTEKILFKSDDFDKGLYDDLSARNSILTVCPNDAQHYLYVDFDDFALAIGDTLFAFDGTTTAAPAIGTGTGVGAFQMNGGTVAASCSPEINPTGCLTFLFQTNGDNQKSTGWKSWLTCADRNLQLNAPAPQFITLECGVITATTTIGTADIESTCSVSNDSMLVEIINNHGTVCQDTCLRQGDTFTTSNLAIGKYTVRYQLKAFPEVSAESYLVISAHSLTCNDEVESIIGSACMAEVRPDHVLESYCDTFANMYYDIVIKTHSGQVLASGTSRNGAYPVVTKDMVDVCGNTKYHVEITRVFDYNGMACNENLVEEVCWTEIQFVDGIAPIIRTEEQDTVIACGVDFEEFQHFLKTPDVLENCGETELTIAHHQLISGDECSDYRSYLVIWEATDECGKTGRATDTLVVARPSYQHAIKLPNVYLSCGEDTDEAMEDYDKLGTIRIPMAGDTVTLSTEEYICKMILIKEDEVVPHPGGKKIARYWSVVDWCTGGIAPVRVDTQIIEFVDTIPPVLECSPHHTLETAQIIPLPKDACERTVQLTAPTVFDTCGAPEISMYTVEQLQNGEWVTIAPNLGAAGALPCDTFRAGWVATDLGLNDELMQDSCYHYFELKDVTPPNMVCRDEVRVSYDKDNIRLYVADIENRNTDACGIIHTEIRRMGTTEWKEYLDLGCEDVHTTIIAELRATDKGGNTNTCSFNVIITDNIPPICQELNDFYGNCDDFHNEELGASTDQNGNRSFDGNEWTDLTGDLLVFYNEKFGDPLCEDNIACVPYSSQQQYQVIYHDCGNIEARRRYRVIDWNGQGIASQWYHQEIHIEYRENWSVTLPADFVGECGDDVPEAMIDIVNGGCDLIAWEHEDRQFDLVEDVCFKVVRTYHIINWCNYEEGEEPIELVRQENARGLVTENITITSEEVAEHGYYTYTQVLKVTDNTPPRISINDVATCIYGGGDFDPPGVEDLSPGEAPYECDTVRVFSAEASDCPISNFDNFSFEYEVYEDDSLVHTGAGSKFFWVVQPKVKYTIRFTTYDNCGNQATREKDFEFWDCKKPAVICYDSLAVDINADGEALVHAQAFDKGSYDNCTPANELKRKIWHVSWSPEPPVTKEAVADLPEAITLGCDYLDDQQVHLYILDEENNFDFCITTIHVNDSRNYCPTAERAMVAGNIHTPQNRIVTDVAVQVMTDGVMQQSVMTNANGDFNIELQRGHNYELIPYKNDNPLEGVTTFDLVLISKHILGLQSFENPWQYLAADVNQSGTITAFDLVQVRQLILNITTEFQQNTSWRFVPADYDFGNQNPLQQELTTSILLNNHQSDRIALDFMAIKTGDVNGTASNNWQSATARQTTTITLENQSVRAGEEIEVVLNNKVSNWSGLQMAMELDGLEFLEITDGQMNEQHIGKNLLVRNLLLFSWDEWSAADADQLATLRFKATRNGQLSEMIQLQPEVMTNEVYTSEGAIQHLQLTFDTATETLLLAQNRPNPFADETEITSYLPTAGTATLKVFDVRGRTVWETVQSLPKGNHTWRIDRKVLPSGGIYYYQLSTDNQVAARKMIVY